MQFKQELTSKHYALSYRLRLFDTVVTPTVLYGVGTLAMTKTHEELLQRTQRRMLRMVLGSKRRPLPSEKVVDAVDFDSDAEKEDLEQLVSENARDSRELEPWVDWIKRATHDVEEKCKKLDIPSWVGKARSLKWSLAQRIIVQESSRWSRQILAWGPFPRLEVQREEQAGAAQSSLDR